MATKRKFKSEAFEAIHSSDRALLKVGAIDKATMREFDQSCLATPSEIAPRKRAWSARDRKNRGEALHHVGEHRSDEGIQRGIVDRSSLIRGRGLKAGRIAFGLQQERGNVCGRINCADTRSFRVQIEMRHFGSGMIPFGFTNPRVEPVETGFTGFQFGMHLREFRTETRTQTRHRFVGMANDTTPGGKEALSSCGVGLVSHGR